MSRRTEITDVWTAVVEANHDRTSVSVYTDEHVAGFEDGSLTPGMSQGEIGHGFR
jgi:hypothetical protein